MTIHNRGFHPTASVVASANGANPLTANINAVVGKITRIHGIEVGYGTVASRQSVRVEDAGAVAWATIVNDVGTFPMDSAPLELSRGTSIQILADQPGGSEDGKLTVRYTQSKD
jgi:hypothetical protein